MLRKNYFVVLLVMLSCNSRQSANFETLDLTGKHLTAIPDSVFQHTKLEVLYVQNPIETDTSFLMLNQIHDESDNRIVVIPERIKKLKRLRVLNIADNDLHSLSPALTTLEQLDTLNISYNSNLHIAKELQVLEKLQSLRWLDITATDYNEETLSHLKHSLYKTRIITNAKEAGYDSDK